jgi:site-specific DNA recombinase
MVLIDELLRAGCRVEFIDHPMSQDPHDQLLLQIRGAVAEYERTLITERMRRGRQARIRAGLMLPWTKRPYGYQLHPEHPRDPTGVVVEPVEAVIVAEIFAMYASDGASLAKVVEHLYSLGIPTPTGRPRWTLGTLRGLLTNPLYIGKVYSGRWRYRPARIRRSATRPMGRPHDSSDLTPTDSWTLVATIPAIVSQEQFDLVQTKLSHNQAFAKRNNKTHQYLLRALVSCGKCGYSCVGRKNGKHGYYVCSSKDKNLRAACADGCLSRHIPTQQLDDLVWQDLCDVLLHPESIIEALERAHGGHWLPQELQARRENLRKARHALSQQIDRLTNAYLRSLIPLAEFERRRSDLEQKDQALAHQEEQLSREAVNHESLLAPAAGIDEFCTRVRVGLQHASFEQKRRLVELLIDRVIVDSEQVEIHYAIPTAPAGETARFCHLRMAYFTHPHLIGSLDREITHEIRIALEFMIGVRREDRLPAAFWLDSSLFHQPPHAFGVELTEALLLA